jgi:hypothetical protein
VTPTDSATGRHRLRLILALALFAGLALGACSRVGIAYNGGSLFIKTYVREYLDLDSAQIKAWEPILGRELARHRAEELPHLAAFLDQALAASQRGFDAQNTACLNASLMTLYQRQAGFAVNLAAPLLADLTDTQRDRLADRFAREAEKSRAELAATTAEAERLRRAKRYVKSIEDWIGPLSEAQRDIVVDVTARFPASQTALVEYRSRKRDELIALLQSQADRAAIADFLKAWLVEFRDLPPDLERNGREIGERSSELLVRLGATLTPDQRKRLDTRLTALRDDLLNLQEAPRMAPLSC